MLRFFIVNSDHSWTFWTVMPTHLQGFPQIVESRYIVSIYYFIPSFHCSLRLGSNFCCRPCRFRFSLPYVHVWWVGNIFGVGIWCTLGVIQALKTRFVSSRPVLNSSTACAELFTLLQCYSTTPLELSTRPTHLRSVIHPSIWMGDQNETNNAINLHVPNIKNN